MPDIPPIQPWGREHRAFRREQARQLAKEIMRKVPDPMEGKKAKLGFLATYWSALLGCILGAYWLMDSHIFWASTLFAVALLQVFLGMWLWFGALWKPMVKITITTAAVAVFTYFDYGWIIYANTPTYVYLVPTSELIDAERRAFFVEQSGPRPLNNVEITLLDNKSGNVHVEKYPQIDPTPQNKLNPRYFWIVPSSPWDEDYTVTVTSSQHPKMTQNMVVRSTKHVLQFAVEVTLGGTAQSVLSCRDSLLPSSYALAHDSAQPCDMFRAIPEELQRRLDPAPYGVELPDGSFRMMRQRVLPTPSELESQSENRHLWEYGKTKLRDEVSAYRGDKLLILTTAGSKTREYAQEFHDTFQMAQWMVMGLKPAPALNERMVDIQVSAKVCGPPALAILRGLTSAGVKHRQGCVNDPNISDRLIVLWVGPKSPSGINPDDCLPAEFAPRQGEQHTCEMTKQGNVPFPPP